MFINKLHLHNFRCYEDLEITFTDKITVIVGNNGAGKTSILEGGVIAASSFFLDLDGVSSGSIIQSDALLRCYSFDGSEDDVQSQYPVEIAAEGDVTEGKVWKRSLNGINGKTTISDAKSIKNRSKDSQKRLRKGDDTLVLPIIAYYGTGRLWDNHRAKRANMLTQNPKTNTRTNGYIDAIDGTASIKLMYEWFAKKTIQKYQYKEIGKGEVHELEIVYFVLEKYFMKMTGYTDVKIQYNLNTNQLEVYYTNNGEKTRIPLNLLSAGYKGTLSLIADIAYRMTVLNPQLKQGALENTDGIIFIDEIDLHLHPIWQQSILEDLSEIFPKVQFVVSTHAPAVINSTRSSSLRILKNQEIVEVVNQVYGNDVNSILNNIMGTEERPVAVSNMFKLFYSEMSKSEFDAAEAILDDIDKLRGYNDKEVAGCRIKLKLERIRKGGKA